LHAISLRLELCVLCVSVDNIQDKKSALKSAT